MTSGIQITASADTATVLRAITGVENALSSASLESWLNGTANAYVRDRTSHRFASEGDDVTGKWQQLSPVTQAIREAKGFGGAHPINKRTGELEAYMISAGRTEMTSSGAEMITPGEAPQGELALKVELAQKGGSSSFGTPVPKRPVMGINERDALALTTLLEIHIESHLAAGGIGGGL